MKTTNKAFKALVQEHIMECLSQDYTTRPNEQLANVISAFDNWYTRYEQKQTPNQQEAFTQFLGGLPSELSVEYSSFMICETLKYWFTHETVGMDFKERSADKEAQTYYYLIYREFKALCKKHNLKF